MFYRDFLFGLLGVVGGLLCAVGDILLDLKGKGNVKSGPYGIVDSNWQKMPEWRFRVSILLAAVGGPLCFFGLLAMINQIARGNVALGTWFLIFAVIGSTGGFFIHTILCCFPIITKTLRQKGVGPEIENALLKKLVSAIQIPFFAMFAALIIATSIVLMIAIAKRYLPLPMICVVLNPLVFLIVGALFRLVNKLKFAELPGIVMPSLGLSMIGLLAAISALC